MLKRGKWLVLALILVLSMSVFAGAALAGGGPQGKAAPGNGRGAGYGPGWGGGLCFTAIADVLGLQPQELRAAFQNGKTLSDLAGEKGMTFDQLKEKASASVKEKLDQAVASGSLGQAQADQIMQRFEQRFESGGINNCPMGGQAGRRFCGGNGWRFQN